MSSTVKTIENPEIPGLECLLPPPPPPPPPPVISEAGIKERGTAAAAALATSGSEKTKGTTISAPSVKTKTASEDGKLDTGETDKLPKERATGTGGKVTNATVISVGNVTKPGIVQDAPLFPETPPAPYFLQTAVPQINQVAVGEPQPWWVPTDSDITEEKSVGAAWLEKSLAWAAESSRKVPSPTTKAKFFKRKSECIDPAQDAERVANAQRELSALMKPLNCDLCNAIMNSTLQAKLHYEGKPHQKKVSMFLNQSVKKVKSDDGQVTSTTCSTDWNTYCDVCKTWFTSQIDANQHYAGKKHIRATTGGTRQKTKKPANQALVDPTGRFGIGIPFATETPPTTPSITEIAVVPAPIVPTAPPAVAYQTPAAWPLPAFRCELCGVTANRLEQLETHKRGAKHMRMLKMSGLANSDVDESNDSTAQSTPSSIDYSIYRTPSGHYYCAPCNRSFHSENSFAQHVESKKHKTQVNPKQVTPSVPTVSKKANKSSK